MLSAARHLSCTFSSLPHERSFKQNPWQEENLTFWLRTRKWKSLLSSLEDLFLRHTHKCDARLRKDVGNLEHSHSVYSPTTASSSSRVHWTIDLLSKFFKLCVAESDAISWKRAAKSKRKSLLGNRENDKVRKAFLLSGRKSLSNYLSGRDCDRDFPQPNHVLERLCAR